MKRSIAVTSCFIIIFFSSFRQNKLKTINTTSQKAKNIQQYWFVLLQKANSINQYTTTAANIQKAPIENIGILFNKDILKFASPFSNESLA